MIMPYMEQKGLILKTVLQLHGKIANGDMLMRA
ncbi:hypothetical protein HALLA_09680 [Halostagnicola larsenii XH-48]|uniref:Uncharacterized protein n=1 Tax=Halostagnicola larsenii XH-48 TaxID=797299 RepID=W0JUE2_9EURY|nr:hypothetical protein HALLA_09515 [Halostagnicola larsenii XH-48]AHG00855.1 hypothetical protein HALLA_09680 [Halostagnicola larsenii XH-48]